MKIIYFPSNSAPFKFANMVIATSIEEYFNIHIYLLPLETNLNIFYEYILHGFNRSIILKILLHHCRLTRILC